MPKQPDGTNPGLTFQEAARVRRAIAFALAGELDEFPDDMRPLCESALDKMHAIPRGGVMIAFSKQELDVLWEAIGNGAEAVVQPSSGRNAAQKSAFRAAANRIADAAGLGPRY